jgi:hypothetical protein
MVYNDIETIERQPIGVLFKTRIFKPLQDEVFVSGTLKVRVIGVPYVSDISIEQLREKVKKTPDDVYTVAVVHALSALAPEEKIQRFFNEPILDYRDLVFEGCPDVFVFGHYHKDQGIEDLHNVKFVNLGAISRGALTFENLERKPKISTLVFNSQGISVEEHIIPHLDPSEVFDLERKAKIDKELKDLDDFMKSLRQDSVLASSKTPKDWLDSLDWSQYGEDLRSTAFEILEAAEAGVLDA